MEIPHGNGHEETRAPLSRNQILRLALLTGGTIILIFGGYEIVERTWLTGASEQLLHTLHVLRGVCSTVLAAAFISWSLINSLPPLLAPNRDDDDPLLHAEDREIQRIRFCTRWFVQMRWIAILVAATIIFFCVEVAEFLPQTALPYLLATLGGMIVFNLFVLQISRHGIFTRYILQTQVVGDLIPLNLLLHFSGGLENPLYILAIFHVIIAGILVSRAQCYLAATAAGAMFALVSWGEWSQFLDHFTLSIVPHGQHDETHVSLDGSYVVVLNTVFWGALFLTSYFVTKLGEQIRADEQKLRRLASDSQSAHMLLQRSLETTSTAIRVLGRDLQPRWVNDQWTEWFGANGGDPPFKPDSIPPAELTLADGETRVREVHFSTAEGNPPHPFCGPDHESYFRIVTAPILDAEGSVQEVVEMGQDITQQRNDHLQLLRAGQMAAIGELASHVAHEVNNPITIMSAKARLLISRFSKELPAKVNQDLTKIVELSDRVGNIAQGLLSYSRPSTGLRKSLAVQDPVMRSLDLLKQRLGSSNIHIKTEFAHGVPRVDANARELEQVFLNFFLNAVDAMPEGGELSVSTTLQRDAGPQEHDRVAIQVRDTGIGIPPEVQQHIFEPFFTTKEDQRGTGLGLSICYGLIKSHAGEITVESRPGDGTCFTVLLPPIQHSETMARPESNDG